MKGTILIIDDEKEMTDRLVRLLNKEGFSAVGAYAGSEGLDYMINHQVDMVITDMKMAGLDGLAVLKSAKEINPETEVVMVSGYPTVELAVEAMKRGAYDYLQKPINPDELLLLIERCLEKKNLAKELDTERKLRKELEEMNRELKETQAQLVQSEKLATIGEMAAGVAHEINNPLTAVTMNVAMLSSSLEKLVKEEGMTKTVYEKILKNLTVVESEIDRTAKIVKSLLKFSRKSDSEQREPASINELIDRTLEPIEHQLSLINIKLIRKYDLELPKINVNPNQMQQIFLNLITNARDSMSESEGGGGRKRSRFSHPERGAKLLMKKNLSRLLSRIQEKGFPKKS